MAIFGKKSKAAASDASLEPQISNKERMEEYQSSIKIGKESIDVEMKAFKIAANNLSVSAKKISKVKGVFSKQLSKRTERKYGDKIAEYNQSLEEYIRISSHLNWLLNTVSSCYEAVARLNEEENKTRTAKNVRIEAQKYFAKITYEKTKLEKTADGVMMPVATYVR